MSVMGRYGSAAAVVGGILLSFTLVIFVGAALTRTPEMRLFLSTQDVLVGRELQPGEAEGVVAAMDVTFFRMRWLMGPGIAAAVGIFMGVATRVRVWQLAVLAAIPFAGARSGSRGLDSRTVLVDLLRARQPQVSPALISPPQ